jgi:hypothetical protein
VTYELPDIPDYAYPSFVTTDEEKYRWRCSWAVAQEISAENESDGRPNSEFVFYFSRTVYLSDIPTFTPEERAAGVRHPTAWA